MRLHLIAVGERMPTWVSDGYEEYARRLPHGYRLTLHEVSLATRTRGDLQRALAAETARIEAKIPSGAYRIGLDVRGTQFSTAELAQRLAQWRDDGRAVALLIGGPDGLAPDCLQRCDLRWSLSALTFPHALVRPIVAEQLYRAWSILHNHPYHRA